MVTAVKTHKIDISVSRNGNIVLKRNGVKEVTITFPDPSLLDILETLLYKERDYDNFLSFWGDNNLSLGSWLTNLLVMDKDRKISWLFEKSIVDFKGDSNGR